jgi:glutaredoxin-related protein
MAAVAPKEVKLFGSAISGYCTMVHHALGLKGVAYDYVEIDMKNKSEEFLKVNADQDSADSSGRRETDP